MKKLIFGLGMIAVGFSSSVASAKDNFYQVKCCTPYDTCSIATFSGLYFGGNLGAITINTYQNADNNLFYDLEEKNFNITDFTAGAQVGYDWNCTCGLIGLVVDWNWSNIHRIFNTVDNSQEKMRILFDWYLTIRGRLGISLCNCLFYLTTGAALANIETTWTYGTLVTKITKPQWGWIGGVGAEYPLGKRTTIGAEVMVMQFTDRAKLASNPSYKLERSDSVYVGRALLNYRFGNLLNCFFCNRNR